MCVTDKTVHVLRTLRRKTGRRYVVRRKIPWHLSNNQEVQTTGIFVSAMAKEADIGDSR